MLSRYCIYMPDCCRTLQALLEKEVLNLDDVEGLLGKRPFESEQMRNIDRYRGMVAEVLEKGVQSPSTFEDTGACATWQLLD